MESTNISNHQPINKKKLQDSVTKLLNDVRNHIKRVKMEKKKTSNINKKEENFICDNDDFIFSTQSKGKLYYICPKRATENIFFKTTDNGQIKIPYKHLRFAKKQLKNFRDNFDKRFNRYANKQEKADQTKDGISRNSICGEKRKRSLSNNNNNGKYTNTLSTLQIHNPLEGSEPPNKYRKVISSEYRTQIFGSTLINNIYNNKLPKIKFKLINSTSNNNYSINDGNYNDIDDDDIIDIDDDDDTTTDTDEENDNDGDEEEGVNKSNSADFNNHSPIKDIGIYNSLLWNISNGNCAVFNDNVDDICVPEILGNKSNKKIFILKDNKIISRDNITLESTISKGDYDEYSNLPSKTKSFTLFSDTILAFTESKNKNVYRTSFPPSPDFWNLDKKIFSFGKSNSEPNKISNVCKQGILYYYVRNGNELCIDGPDSLPLISEKFNGSIIDIAASKHCVYVLFGNKIWRYSFENGNKINKSIIASGLKIPRSINIVFHDTTLAICNSGDNELVLLSLHDINSNNYRSSKSTAVITLPREFDDKFTPCKILSHHNSVYCLLDKKK